MALAVTTLWVGFVGWLAIKPLIVLLGFDN
jgi:hypothetical protein